MAIFSFSANPRVTAIVGATTIAVLSWAYFSQLWRGVIVSDAGDLGTNGYYVWEPASNSYVKAEVPADGWRVPNVYDLAAQGPNHRSKAGAPKYVIHSLKHETTRSRDWYFRGPNNVGYRNMNGSDSYLDDTPPSTGWTGGRSLDTTAAGLDSPPQVTVCGKKAAPDPAPTESRPSPSPFMPSVGMPAGNLPLQTYNEPGYPGTAILLAINLVVAYYIQAKGVSSDAMGISYTLFWEKRQYWRVFTASFSHFELWHLAMNTLSTYNSRGIEQRLGTFRFLCLTLTLVVATEVVSMLIKHALMKRRGADIKPAQKAVGFSCVLFAYMTYSAVAMNEYCPFGSASRCFKTWKVPILGGVLPDLAVNFGPIASLVVTQATVPRAGFIGHLAGIIMGYAMAWGWLGRLSIPIVAGVSMIFMIHHSQGWAHKMASFSWLLEDWAAGVTKRVARARRLQYAFMGHVCITVGTLCLFTWSSGFAEIIATVVGYSAVQAIQCCCSSDSKPKAHRMCVNLLKGYGALSIALLVSDLLSFGAIMGQSHYMEWSGVPKCLQHRGLALLAVAVIVRAFAVVACIEAGALFSDGQTFLWNTGLRHLSGAFSFKTNAHEGAFPGTGRVLGGARPTVAAEKRNQ